MIQSSDTTLDIAACRARLRARLAHQYHDREQQRQALLRVAAYAIFSRFPGVHRAYLFGTIVCPGALRSTSDVDVAIEGRLSAEDYFALWRELERVAGYRPIDLVELDQSPHFADRIREQGMVIYAHTDSDA